jgi:hypothetical protein
MSKTVKQKKPATQRTRHRERREQDRLSQSLPVRTYRPEPDYPPVLENMPYINARSMLS